MQKSLFQAILLCSFVYSKDFNNKTSGYNRRVNKYTNNSYKKNDLLPYDLETLNNPFAALSKALEKAKRDVNNIKGKFKFTLIFL